MVPNKAALVNAKNSEGMTAFHVAGYSGGGRCSINGIDDTQVIDILLAAGAMKSITDKVGMTAYGRCQIWTSSPVCYPHCRHTVAAMEQKLLPPTGPTTADLKGGPTGSGSGFVDYGPEDDEADREMGRGKYASGGGFDDEDEDGDY